MGLHIIIIGEVTTGLTFYGPYKTKEEAERYAEDIYAYYEHIPFPTIAKLEHKSAFAGEIA